MMNKFESLVNDIGYFNDIESVAAMDHWLSLYNQRLQDLIKSGDALKCRLLDNNRRLRPESTRHSFRENDRVQLIPPPRSYRQRCADIAVNEHHCVILDGIDSNGDFILPRRFPLLCRKVILLPPEPEDDPTASVAAEAIIQDHNGTSTLARSFLLPVQSGISPSIAQNPDAVLHRLVSTDRTIELILGPPGSGKTALAAKTIGELTRCGLSVAYVTHSNRACIEITEACIRAGFERESVQLWGDAWRKLFPDHGSPNYQTIDSMFPYKGKASGTNTFKLVRNWIDRRLDDDTPIARFDAVIVDEASQISVPCLLACSLIARRLILFGDHHQLGPIFNCNDLGKRSVLHISGFEYLWSRVTNRIFLAASYRMRDDVCRVLSDTIYDGALYSATTPAKSWPPPRKTWDYDRRLLQLNPGQQMILTPISDKPHWIQVITSIIHHIFLRGIVPIAQPSTNVADSESSFLISCFNRSGVWMARQELFASNRPLLPKNLVGNIDVDTVDRNQGRSATIAFTCLPFDICDTSELLSNTTHIDYRRLNVGISRARIKSYVVVPASVARLSKSGFSFDTRSRRIFESLLPLAVHT